jgi:hypothetical protein
MKNDHKYRVSIVWTHTLLILLCPLTCLRADGLISHTINTIDSMKRAAFKGFNSMDENSRRDVTASGLAVAASVPFVLAGTDIKGKLAQLDRVYRDRQARNRFWTRGVRGRLSDTGYRIAHDYKNYYHRRFFTPLQRAFECNGGIIGGCLSVAAYHAYYAYKGYREYKRCAE